MKLQFTIEIEYYERPTDLEEAHVAADGWADEIAEAVEAAIKGPGDLSFFDHEILDPELHDPGEAREDEIDRKLKEEAR